MDPGALIPYNELTTFQYVSFIQTGADVAGRLIRSQISWQLIGRSSAAIPDDAAAKVIPLFHRTFARRSIVTNGLPAPLGASK